MRPCITEIIPFNATDVYLILLCYMREIRGHRQKNRAPFPPKPVYKPQSDPFCPSASLSQIQRADFESGIVGKLGRTSRFFDDEISRKGSLWQP
jgi:hypothetical protein